MPHRWEGIAHAKSCTRAKVYFGVSTSELYRGSDGRLPVQMDTMGTASKHLSDNVPQDLAVDMVANEVRRVQCIPDRETEIEQGLTSHQTHYRSYRGWVLKGQMIQPTVSKH